MGAVLFLDRWAAGLRAAAVCWFWGLGCVVVQQRFVLLLHKWFGGAGRCWVGRLLLPVGLLRPIVVVLLEVCDKLDVLAVCLDAVLFAQRLQGAALEAIQLLQLKGGGFHLFFCGLVLQLEAGVGCGVRYHLWVALVACLLGWLVGWCCCFWLLFFFFLSFFLSFFSFLLLLLFWGCCGMISFSGGPTIDLNFSRQKPGCQC